VISELNSMVWHNVFCYAGHEVTENDAAEFGRAHEAKFGTSPQALPSPRFVEWGEVQPASGFCREDVTEIIAMAPFDYLAGIDHSCVIGRLTDGRYFQIVGRNFHHAEPGYAYVANSIDHLLAITSATDVARLGLRDAVDAAVHRLSAPQRVPPPVHPRTTE
jgi:hypothetical protein